MPAATEVTLCGLSDVGLVRQRNEDVLLAKSLRSEEVLPNGLVHRCPADSSAIVLGVFDGMGGAASGHVASGMAADVMGRLGRDGQPGATADLLETLGRGALQANREILGRSRRDASCAGMGTTLTVGAILDGRLHFVHVGDSRGYLLRRGQLVQFTSDQSLSQLLGTRDQAAGTGYPHVILQAVGVGDLLEPTAGRVTLRRGDLLLLCTDGLTDHLTHAEIETAIVAHAQDLGRVARALVETAKARGGHDNISVLLALVEGESLPEAASEDDAPAVERVELRVLRTARQRMRRRQWLLVVAAAVLMAGMAGAIILLGRSRR